MKAFSKKGKRGKGWNQKCRKKYKEEKKYKVDPYRQKVYGICLRPPQKFPSSSPSIFPGVMSDFSPLHCSYHV